VWFLCLFTCVVALSRSRKEKKVKKRNKKTKNKLKKTFGGNSETEAMKVERFLFHVTRN